MKNRTPGARIEEKAEIQKSPLRKFFLERSDFRHGVCHRRIFSRQLDEKKKVGFCGKPYLF
jgi:hypothetical protein